MLDKLCEAVVGDRLGNVYVLHVWHRSKATAAAKSSTAGETVLRQEEDDAARLGSVDDSTAASTTADITTARTSTSQPATSAVGGDTSIDLGLDWIDVDPVNGSEFRRQTSSHLQRALSRSGTLGDWDIDEVDFSVINQAMPRGLTPGDKRAWLSNKQEMVKLALRVQRRNIGAREALKVHSLAAVQIYEQYLRMSGPPPTPPPAVGGRTPWLQC